MKSNENEILNKVLLLMKYDNKKTLTENKILISEQRQTLPNFNDTLGQADWLNRNYGNKDFNSIWKDYLTNISKLDLQKLLEVQKKISEKGYGSITPGLFGFNRPSVGIANIPLENQIYLLKKRNYDKEKETKKIYNPNTRKYQYYGEVPQPPQYNLLTGDVEIQSNQLGVRNKSAQQIISDLNKPKVSKPTTQTKKSDDFKLGTFPKPDSSKFETKIPDISSSIEYQKQIDEYEKQLLSKYDFSKFPSPIDSYMGRPVYQKDYWIEPNTKEKILIQGMTIDDVKRFLLQKIENISQIKMEDEILNDERLIEIFGNDKIKKSIENCKRENLVSFFDKILKGEIKDKKGNTYGKYAKDSSGNSFFVKWPKDKPIPCTDEFWDKYGLYIQLGGMLAVGILSGGLGLSASAAILVELAADTALNLYSLKKNVEAQDEDAIKLDLTYVFLPFLMRAKPIQTMLRNAKFGENTIKSVEDKLKNIPPNATTSQVDNVIKNMTPEEQRVIKELGDEKYANEIQKVSKQTLDNLRKTAKGPLSRKLSNPLIYILVYGSPAAVYMVKKISDLIKQKTGRTIKDEDKKLWEAALSYLNEEDRNNFYNSLQNLDKNTINKIVDVFEKGDLGRRTKEEMKKIIQGKQTDEEFKKSLKDLEDKIKKLNEDLLNSIGDDKIIILNEPTVD